MDVLVLQHIACEPPGVYEDVLRERGAALHRVELDEGEPLPDWRGFGAIVAMGGPMSVNDEAELPWLADEKRLIREAVEAGTPYWGACLGVQLLAAALGGRVYPASAPEVGVLPVEEALFFLLTTFMVAQTTMLFLWRFGDVPGEPWRGWGRAFGRG